MAEYYMILTEIGMSKLINAQLTSSTINIKKFAVGDGGGAYYKPDQSQTALVKEVWRGTVSRIDKDPTNSNWIIVEGIIPATDGNFMIREVGLFDSEGDLIAIGNYPETFKPIAVSGSVKDLIIRCVLEVNNADNVELKIDPTTAIASKQYVDENLTQLDNKVMSQLAEHLRIEIGVAPPENPNSKTFWLEDLGESIDFVLGSGLLIGNASTDGSNDVWFDENV